jgi:lantibiotic modifying enzyme
MAHTPTASSSFLEAAQTAASWIRSTTRETEHGLIWLPDPDQPERTATVTAPATIYSGNAGIILFFLELAQATGDDSYVADAQRGADHIAATWREVLTFEMPLAIENANLAFAMGLSGTAFVLAHVWKVTQAAKYREAARAITQHIVDAAHSTDEGIVWIGAASAGLGDGAIILYLLWAAREFGDPSLRDLAVRAGGPILGAAERDPRGGLKWVGFPVERLGFPPGTYMPNFEFGTAGVAFVLARLYEETSDPRFLAAAREGAAHIQALATVNDDAALLFYREPDLTDLYYLGYCHGPVGTARTFYQLYRVTVEPAYLEWTERFAQGILASGIPEQQTPGLWNVVCQCCGTIGISDFFVSLWQATQRAEYLAYAQRVGAQTLGRASAVDGAGARWYQAWTRTQPDVIAAETGYMIGAAGVGSAFLHLYQAEQGNYDPIVFPDNPFSSREISHIKHRSL